MEERCRSPIAFFIEHTDGLRSTCLVLNGLSSRFLFAARLGGCAEPVACEFWLQEPTFGHFSYLSNAIIEMFRTGKPPYPVERTVITTGVLSAAMGLALRGREEDRDPRAEESRTRPPITTSAPTGTPRPRTRGAEAGSTSSRASRDGES